MQEKAQRFSFAAHNEKKLDTKGWVQSKGQQSKGQQSKGSNQRDSNFALDIDYQ
jgi:hypothetical protein